ncbi:OmpA family protein [Vibrio tapetis subsp. quintayensis]|uniref:OmpA family protein n=1 Tax=Vibrio tapetis TaxID=52443 RepID=UPI0025B528ED|nr:OmpA family protein [Vibrio tapetis]MDN3681186.1 OmpA family protein [Vibrio tapetis subsp. quintayensis]
MWVIKKTFAIALMGILLQGCSALTPPSMLETAPKTSGDLIYPDWGGEEVSANVGQPAVTSNLNQPQVMPMAKPVMASQPMHNTNEMRSLMAFMESNRIKYEVIPGQHTVVKLEQRIHFETGSATITKKSRVWLGQLGGFLSQKPSIKTVIDGHTDSTGGNQINDNLSDKRAMQVKLLLTNNNVATRNVYTRGYGKHLPSCSNISKSGKACNRRVELMFIEAIN